MPDPIPRRDFLKTGAAAGVEVPALCDINEAHLNRGIDVVEEARQAS